MHKILISGHPSSKFKNAVELLYSFGIKKAKPSRRAGFTQEEITQIRRYSHAY